MKDVCNEIQYTNEKILTTGEREPGPLDQKASA